MRVALFARVPDVVVQMDALLRELGHECVGVVTTEGPRGRYGEDLLSALIDVRPPHLDVLVASGPARFAKLLEALEPDLALCGGFPVRIPEDALAVPRHGAVNGHPALLPRALERVEAGDPGDAQGGEGASYAGFFEPEFAEVVWTRPAQEVHRQVRAWWAAAARNGVRGPLAEVGGERVYVL